METTFDNVKSYATEANLRKALAKAGLDSYTDTDGKGRTVPLRYMVVRTAEGRWTAIFMVGDLLRQCGGYVGVASQHGFASV